MATVFGTGRRAPGSLGRGTLPALLLLLLVLVVAAPAVARPAAPPVAAGGPLVAAVPGGAFLNGTVVDQYSGHPLAHATVRSLGESLLWDNTTTDAEGRFELRSVPGILYVTVDPPPGYQGVQVHVTVANGSNPLLVLALVPVGLLAQTSSADDAVWAAGLIAATLGVVAGGAAAAIRARAREASPRPLLTRFGWYTLGRVALLPFQILALLVVLYIFGTYLPALAKANLTGCLVQPNGSCAPCLYSQLSCQVPYFWNGLYAFAHGLVTGQWGLASIGFVTLPATDFLQWWLPYSLELAAFALLLSIVIGYPLGLAAGWREGGAVDQGLRGTSLTLLLVPTFLVVLLVLLLVYNPWLAFFGDDPYRLTPGPAWFLANGGFPRWIGTGGQTSPTGFPILDGAIHGDWPYVGVVVAKNLLQALLIATIYVAIFFRYARQAVAAAARSSALRAARARGVSEATLLWRHTGRRVLPIYLLTFGMTLPAYLGTQAVVEALFNDTPGIGTILFSEMTEVGTSGFGFTHLGPVEFGNLYQVIILFLAITLLVGNLCADILARLLDPTLPTEGRR